MDQPEINNFSRRSIWLAAALSLVFIMVAAWPLIFTGSADVNMVEAFNPDEASHVRLIRKALDSGSLYLNFPFYGHLHFNAALMPLKMASLFSPVSDQTIIITLRLASAFFGFLSLVFTFLLARRLHGSLAGWTAWLILALGAVPLVRYSGMSHPDTAQLCFVVLGLYYTVRLAEEDSGKWLIAASLAIGLAFGAKYSGLFLLPLLVLVALLNSLSTYQPNPLVLGGRGAVRATALILGILFLTLGVLTGPEIVAKLLGGNQHQGAAVLARALALRLGLLGTGGGLILLAWLSSRPSIADLTGRMLVIGLVFLAAFSLVSPDSWVNLQFVKGMIYESVHTSFGHITKSQAGWRVWFSLLIGREMPGPGLVALAGLGLLLSVFQIFKKSPGRGFKPVHVVALWAVLYFSFLAVQVKMVMGHYLLPALPALAVLAAAPVGALARSQKYARVTRPLAWAVFGGVVLWLAFYSSPSLLDLHSRTWSRESAKPSIQAGQWLAANYSPDCRVISDAYGYIPAVFKAGKITWRGNFAEASRFKTDLIITTRAIEKRFQKPSEAKNYRFGEKAYLAAFNYYRALRSGDSSFKLVREFGPVRIYADKNTACLK